MQNNKLPLNLSRSNSQILARNGYKVEKTDMHCYNHFRPRFKSTEKTAAVCSNYKFKCILTRVYIDAGIGVPFP